MNELTFIPLKTADGQVAGHARVQDGVVGFRLRAPAGAQVLILTEGGYVTGETGSHIRAGGRVLCVALHERGKLRCCGFASGCPYTAEDVRARLITLFPAPSATPPDTTPSVAPAVASGAEAGSSLPEEAVCTDAWTVPLCENQAEPDPPPLTLPARTHAAKAAADKPGENHDHAKEKVCPDAVPCEAPVWAGGAAESAPVSLEDGSGDTRPPRKPGDEGADRMPEVSDDGPVSARSVLQQLKSETGAAFFDVPEVMPETPDDTACRAEEFAALLARCERVFERIAASPEHAVLPAEEERPPIDAPRRQDDAPHRQDDAHRAAIDGWNESVDALLAFPAAPANAQSPARSPVRAPVINPFPHIFPDARFYSECDSAGTNMLIGTWRRGTEQFTVTAVRGEYCPRPPEHLPGFTRYIRTRQGGFWVRVDD